MKLEYRKKIQEGKMNPVLYIIKTAKKCQKVIIKMRTPNAEKGLRLNQRNQ